VLNLLRLWLGELEMVGSRVLSLIERLIVSGPTMPGHLFLPQPNDFTSPFRHADGSYDWRTELEYGWSMVDQASCGSLAACIVEVVQGDGGCVCLPPGYLRELKEQCKSRGMLLIVDEAQTGFGRTGKLFGCEHDGVTPDILTISKPLGSGYPVSAVVTSTKVDELCRQRGYMFYTSHMNDPLPTAIGDKVLEIVLRDNLAKNALALGNWLKDGLIKLKETYGIIADVRGRGLLIGVQIEACHGSTSCTVGKELTRCLLDRGLWVNMQIHKGQNCVLRIGPPLVSTREQIDEGLRIFEQALVTVCEFYKESH
jgi:4-aminobutyrate aminotransferase-like enzyme